MSRDGGPILPLCPHPRLPWSALPTGVSWTSESGTAMLMSLHTVSGLWEASWDSTATVDATYTLTVTVTDTSSQTATAATSVTTVNGPPATIYSAAGSDGTITLQVRALSLDKRGKTSDRISISEAVVSSTLGKKGARRCKCLRALASPTLRALRSPPQDRKCRRLRQSRSCGCSHPPDQSAGAKAR